MSAKIIAFTVRQPRKPRHVNDYAFVEAEARRFVMEMRIKETMAKAEPEPAKPTPEDEILKLLLRIDGRLDKLSVA